MLGWLGIRHETMPPYTPRVNGKVERFTRTLMNEWAYAHACPSSEERAATSLRGSITTTGAGRMAA